MQLPDWLTKPISRLGRNSEGSGAPKSTPEGGSVSASAPARVVGRTAEEDLSIEERMAVLEERVTTLATFQSNFNHDLRSDLTAILGFIGPLVEKAKSGGTADLNQLQTVEYAANHMQSLVEGARVFVALEIGRITASPTPTDFDTLVSDVGRNASKAANRKGNQVKMNQLAKIGWSLVDGAKVRQILAAITSNANKFTAGGMIEINSDLVTDQYGSWIEVAVADTGVGIAKEDHERAFHVFGLARPNLRGEREGTRMSLSISRRLARLLGGDIFLSSDPGIGSTFTLRLPYTPTDAI